MAQTTLISIAGMSACGKTTLARDLAVALSAPIVAMDDYYHDIATFGLTADQVADVNWDTLQVFNTAQFGKDIAQLAAGNPIHRPNYDFTLSKPNGHTPVHPTEYIVVEGQFTLCVPEVVEFCTLNLFVDLDLRSALRRRMHRDTIERGRDQEGVLRQWNDHVVPAWNKWVSPSRRLADLTLNGDDDRETNVEQVLQTLLTKTNQLASVY